MRRILKEEHFDVVHVHEPLVSFLPIAVPALLRRDQRRHLPCGARKRRPALQLHASACSCRAFRRLDGKIAVSQAAASLIQPHFPGYYNIIPNGVEVERFAAPQEPLPELDDGMINILFVGRLEKRKGLRYLLRAFERVKARRPDTRLVVAGGYDDRQRRGYERWVESPA